MNKMCQKDLFALLNQVSFMLDDITLYLNTHPDCQEALSSYEHYKQLREDVLKDYTEMYGPITKYNVNSNNYWDWVNRPWPWEGEC